MKIAWWILLIVVLSAGTFLWHNGRGSTSDNFIFDNMRKQDGVAPAIIPPQTLASSAGDSLFPDSSLVFAAKGGSYFQTGMREGCFGDFLPPETRGRDGIAVYGRYCACCHGVNGDGKGAMAGYSEFPAIGSFWSDKYKDYPAGKIFRSIADGQGNMPSFSSRMTAMEIWEAVSRVIEFKKLRGAMNGKEEQ